MNKKLAPQLLEFAKSMRHTATDAENLMWQLLRAKRFISLKFIYGDDFVRFNEISH